MESSPAVVCGAAIAVFALVSAGDPFVRLLWSCPFVRHAVQAGLAAITLFGAFGLVGVEVVVAATVVGVSVAVWIHAGDGEVARATRGMAAAVGLAALAVTIGPAGDPEPALVGPPDGGSALPLVTASARRGTAPLRVVFDVRSGDPDAAPLDVRWDFDGDGAFDDAGTPVSHTFLTPGRYEIRLRVSDGRGRRWSGSVTLVVEPPPGSIAGSPGIRVGAVSRKLPSWG